jgi:hypothetical protein
MRDMNIVRLRPWFNVLMLVLCAACAPSTKAPAPQPAPAPTPAPTAHALPANAEVELAGTVHWPPTATGTPKVYIEDGPCFEHTSLAIAVVPVSATGGFGHEIFVPQRSKLWICAGLVDAHGEILYSGSAADLPFVAEGAGEVVIPRTEINLAPAPVPLKVPKSL